MPEDWIADAVATLRPLVTLKEASELLRISYRQVQRKIATGELRSARIRETGSSRVLISRTELERYLRGLVVT